VDNALASFVAENSIKFWDITKGNVSMIKGPSGQFLDINWAQDANRLVLPAKDKRIHAYDVQAGTEILNVPGHQGLKGGRAVFYDKLNHITSTGFGASAARHASPGGRHRLQLGCFHHLR
jgi:WD40 repeat protein